MKDDDSWNKEGKYVVIIIFFVIALTLFGVVKSCVDGELFNNNNPSDPTMRPIGGGH